ncbi:uncharacterized protein LOC109894925 [Oncorhynchus kisutch]|uniref:uncharacterized protein LOC109894925 n=1 Tax=Oncorhynchus kisutch TaxID=8019 RepID=UPI0012DE86FC|nr:uncharacterized protein LOC109894925 [Oncorhynchus kisutch]
MVQCASGKRKKIRKMTCNSSFWAHVFMTAYLLWVTGRVAQKVYFDCGAKVDVVDVQGLILSPGFPYNYSSGTHCVWQFFVPVGHQLILEIFDFDVFESHDPSAQYNAISNLKVEDAEADNGATFPSGGPVTDENMSMLAKDVPVTQAQGGRSKAPQSSFQHDKVKQVVVQEQSTKMEIAKVSNSAKRSTSDIASSHLLPRDQAAVNSITSPLLRGDPDLNPTPNPRAAAPDLAVVVDKATSPTPTDNESVSSETQVVDACPHDVLYISDLLTFSSRFCGSNRPSSSQLVFGSSQEMVEVIMELITTTHWGRGFALLFHYHNRTEPDGDDPRHAYAPAGASKMGSLLAAMSGAAFFAMVLTSALCIIFRPKLCPKRASSCSSNNSEVQEGVQNSGADVRELQLVAPNQPSLEVPRTAENDNNHSLSLTHTGSPVSVGGDMSEHAEVDLSSNGLTELDLGTDEVFIISSAPSTSSRLLFSAHTQRERFLRHSDTGPGPVSDWPSPDPAASPTETRAAQDGCARPRPRAWSVRTFQDFLPPLPQLHKKWCSWNSTSPFTKLVDSAPSGFVSECRGDDSRKVFSDPQLEAQDDSNASSMSNVSYPLTLPAQRQRRLNSTSNMRRSRFTGPCFGLLSGSSPSDSTKAPGGSLLQASPSQPSNSTSGQGQPEEVQGGKRRDFPAESDHVSVPVFAICEEEDRQPLILAEHLGHSSMLNGLSRGVYEAKGPAGGSLNPGPQSAANGPLLQRGRSEWRPWGSQASGGASPYPLPHPSGSHTATNTNESAFVHSTANQIQMPSLSQLTVPCSVTGNVTSDSPASSPCDRRADRQSMHSWVGPAKQ